jgi:hypothetical protein
MNPTPFPDLDAIYQMRLPWFDMSDQMVAEDTAYCSMLDYIAVNGNTVKSTTILQVVLCVLCYAGGVAFVVISCMADKKKDRNGRLMDHSEVERAEMEDKDKDE